MNERGTMTPLTRDLHRGIPVMRQFNCFSSRILHSNGRGPGVRTEGQEGEGCSNQGGISLEHAEAFLPSAHLTHHIGGHSLIAEASVPAQDPTEKQDRKAVLRQ